MSNKNIRFSRPALWFRCRGRGEHSHITSALSGGEGRGFGPKADLVLKRCGQTDCGSEKSLNYVNVICDRLRRFYGVLLKRAVSCLHANDGSSRLCAEVAKFSPRHDSWVNGDKISRVQVRISIQPLLSFPQFPVQCISIRLLLCFCWWWPQGSEGLICKSIPWSAPGKVRQLICKCKDKSSPPSPSSFVIFRRDSWAKRIKLGGHA